MMGLELQHSIELGCVRMLEIYGKVRLLVWASTYPTLARAPDEGV
jgi:hypothetical protein